MPKFPDLGVALSLSGAEILASYVAGNALYVGAVPRVRFYGKIAGKVSTLISPVKLKIQAYDDIRAVWYDVESEDDTDEIAAAPVIEHSFAVSSGATVDVSLTVDGSYPRVRIAAIAAAQGSAEDAIVLEARAVGP